MKRTLRVRAALAVHKHNIPAVLARAEAIHTGMSADTATYAAPNPPLPAFLTLIQNLDTAQRSVPAGTRGRAAERDVHRDLLITAMESQRMYVQGLADAAPARAVSIVENAGMVVAAAHAHAQVPLKLTRGVPSGTVLCDASPGLLMSAGAKRSRRSRVFNWQYTADGGKTFVSVPSTPTGKTTIPNLPPLTTVGVRVNLATAAGAGEWSQVVTIVVH